MIPSRKLAAMFLCVFLLGSVVGGLITYNFGGAHFSDFLNRTSDPSALAQRIDRKLTAKYKLDPGQQARISPITRELAQNLYQARRKFAGDVFATLDASHAKISAEMTAEQRNAFLQDMAEKRRVSTTMLVPGTNFGNPAQQ